MREQALAMGTRDRPRAVTRAVPSRPLPWLHRANILNTGGGVLPELR